MALPRPRLRAHTEAMPPADADIAASSPSAPAPYKDEFYKVLNRRVIDIDSRLSMMQASMNAHVVPPSALEMKQLEAKMQKLQDQVDGRFPSSRGSPPSQQEAVGGSTPRPAPPLAGDVRKLEETVGRLQDYVDNRLSYVDNRLSAQESFSQPPPPWRELKQLEDKLQKQQDDLDDRLSAQEGLPRHPPPPSAHELKELEEKVQKLVEHVESQVSGQEGLARPSAQELRGLEEKVQRVVEYVDGQLFNDTQQASACELRQLEETVQKLQDDAASQRLAEKVQKLQDDAASQRSVLEGLAKGRGTTGDAQHIEPQAHKLEQLEEHVQKLQGYYDTHRAILESAWEIQGLEEKMQKMVDYVENLVPPSVEEMRQLEQKMQDMLAYTDNQLSTLESLSHLQESVGDEALIPASAHELRELEEKVQKIMERFDGQAQEGFPQHLALLSAHKVGQLDEKAPLHEVDSNASTLSKEATEVGQAAITVLAERIQENFSTAEQKQKDHDNAIRRLQDRLDALTNLRGGGGPAPTQAAPLGHQGLDELQDKVVAIEQQQRCLVERTAAMESTVAEETYTNQKLRENFVDIVEQSQGELENAIQKLRDEMYLLSNSKETSLVASLMALDQKFHDSFGGIEKQQADLDSQVQSKFKKLVELTQKKLDSKMPADQEPYADLARRLNSIQEDLRGHYERSSAAELGLREAMEEHREATSQKCDKFIEEQSAAIAGAIKELREQPGAPGGPQKGELDQKIHAVVDKYFHDLQSSYRKNHEQTSGISASLRSVTATLNSIHDGAIDKILQDKMSVFEQERQLSSRRNSVCGSIAGQSFNNSFLQEPASNAGTFVESREPIDVGGCSEDKLRQVEKQQWHHSKRLDDIQRYLRKHHAAESSLWKALDQKIIKLVQDRQPGKT
mmetsp:Transcript_75872/g.214540  ORF Transcript_75872/g.214540 Transcript_75872/m.214540 type:complete len:906 (-) Transcript_75872:62-2779(-)